MPGSIEDGHRGPWVAVRQRERDAIADDRVAVGAD
jgi:hypothetical protein